MEADGDRARIVRVLLFTMTTALFANSAAAQLGALVSPGRLNHAHAALEGVSNCLSCHTAGQQVSAAKCLACHRPIGERIARKIGVHRQVTTDCVSCHVEHAGADAELRPFDQRAFDHAVDTTFPLDGEHARLRGDCAACHKTRSFLAVSAGCVSCHTDTHKGTLGAQCTSCHSTAVRFRDADTRFDHSRTAFPLTGAHAQAACTGCHADNTYKGVRFASCTACHSDVHRQRLGTGCSSCHTTTAWRTTRIDHARTAFPLVEKHAAVSCVKCHISPAAKVKPAAATCAACHADPHRGLFPSDCASCHTEAGFQKGRFDHATTRFPLTERHAAVPCADCHDRAPAPGGRPAASRQVRAVEFRGLSTTCQSCHTDVHRAELGASCETCHSARTFAVTPFTHAKDRAFFKGAHTPLPCAGCHASTLAPLRASAREPALRVGFPDTPAACVSCHRDVHLGQVGVRCESCHDVAGHRFQLAGFTHRATSFPLTGRHDQIECAACHKVEAREYPAGRGEARRLTGLGTNCVACHEDVHGAELSTSCEQCHSTDRFAITGYTHRNARTLRAFFSGAHDAASCERCHKATAPAASGVRPRPSFRASTACVSCHTDVHRGALGPKCETCHRW